jgi:hypothetical protein
VGGLVRIVLGLAHLLRDRVLVAALIEHLRQETGTVHEVRSRFGEQVVERGLKWSDAESHAMAPVGDYRPRSC